MDVHTLAVVLGLANLLQVTALSIQYLVDRTHRGSGWWALGSATSALGFFFTFLLDAPIIGPVANAVNNTLFVSGLTLTYVGVLRCLDQRERRGWLIAFVAATALTPIYFTYINGNLALRRVVISVAFAAILFLISHAFFVHKTRSVATAANFLAAVFLANGVFFVMRALAALAAGTVEDPFTPTLTRTAGYVVALTASTLWTLGFIILVNQRLNADNSEARDNLELIFNTIPDAVVITRVTDGRLVRVNQGFTALSGFTRDEVLGKSSLDLNIWRDPADCQRVWTTLTDMGSCDNTEAIFVRKDGGQLIVVVSAKSIVLQGIPHLVSVTRNITERKRAEEEHAALEAQLQHAHQMESVGRLAGGVAQDFNNMLGVILGHAEMAVEQVARDQPLRADLVEIQKAAQRAAELTRQLLAFARKQMVTPSVIDLNETVAGTLSMLGRMIGGDIRLAWQPGASLWPVKIDPSQMEQILANLCVNARDAIAGVGTITIATSNAVDDADWTDIADAVPGEYVRLDVSDTGCGMHAETLSHVFEPFFTTKGVGKGTGMGLASVFGAVNQNGGVIQVRSVPGAGTTFRIYLPRQAATLIPSGTEGESTPRPLGGEQPGL